MGSQVPDDTAAVAWAAHSLVIVSSELKIIPFSYLNRPNSISMLFHRCFHTLALPSDPPDSNLAFHTSRDNFSAIWGCCDGSYSVRVGIVDYVHKFSALGVESTDFAIRPSRDYALAVAHKADTVALNCWNLNSKNFMSVFCVPNPNFV